MFSCRKIAREQNIERARGHNIKTLIAMGGTDVRLWRYEGIPA